MLTFYVQYSKYELRVLRELCLDFCIYQYEEDTPPYSDICADCERRRVCKDLTNLAHHCETLINSRKSAHC